MRALKDPFPPARIAAIGSMGATHAFISTSDLSSRVLPALCTVTVDKEKPVRDQAFQTIRFFLAKLEKLSEDPQAAAEQEKIEGKQAIQGQTNRQQMTNKQMTNWQTNKQKPIITLFSCSFCK